MHLSRNQELTPSTSKWDIVVVLRSHGRGLYQIFTIGSTRLAEGRSWKQTLPFDSLDLFVTDDPAEKCASAA